jgi:hypothetical protein
MAKDNSHNFNRPLIQGKNDLLRANLNADTTSFPVTEMAPSNRQPQKSDHSNKPINRGQITRRDDDDIKDISIGLLDHDEAIAYYMEQVIKPSIISNGNRIDVPLIYGSPERWKSVQQNGYHRDKEGKLQTPLIMFKRDSIEKRRDLGNKMDANNPNLYYTFQAKFTKRNQYDNFSVLQNRTPQREMHAVVIPDFVKLKYSFVIWTDYVAQMNKIVEAINYASDSYWGNEERFKFNAKIDTFTNKVEVAQGSNRMVKTDFGLELQGYIIPDALNAVLAKKPQKFFTKSTVVFNTETVSSFQPTKSRDQIREEAGEYQVGRGGEGIGYDRVGNQEI